MRSVRFGVCTLALVVLFALLGGSADSARTQGGADWTLKPVAPAQKWLRVDVQGDTLYGFRLRGTDFTVTGIKSVRASGGATPQCSVSGNPSTLACDGELVGGISVFVQLGTTGSGGAYEFAFLFAPGDTNLIYVPSNQTAPPTPLGGSLGFTSPTSARVTIRNPSSSHATLEGLEVAPIGFSVTSVATPDCGLTEGAGIACNSPLAPGKTAVIRFATTPAPARVSAYLLASRGGATTGFLYAQAGAACPDLEAALASAQAERHAIEVELPKLNRAVHAARGAAVPPGRVKAMNAAIARLQLRLKAVRAVLRGRQQQLQDCEQGKRKLAAASTCNAELKAAGDAGGVVKGLNDALRYERRVAAIARPLIVRLKKLGPRAGAGWRNSLVHLTALSRLPGKTGHTLAGAKAAVKRAQSALEQCDAALDQG